MKKLLLASMFFLVFAGCSNHPMGDHEPLGTIVDRKLICTDMLQKVDGGYKSREFSAKPIRLFGDDCFVEEYKRYRQAMPDGNEWMPDTVWMLKIRVHDEEEEPYFVYKEWSFFYWDELDWDKDSVPIKWRQEYRDPRIGSLYYSQTLWWPGSDFVDDDLLKLMKESTPVRSPHIVMFNTPTPTPTE